MTEPALEARKVTKHYGHVLALDGADFTAFPGEVVALIGDNGAGKSTLVKTLAGAIRPDDGEILVDGSPVTLTSPLDARRHGIEAVYQDLALAPDLDSAANLYLGREISFVPFVRVLNRRAMRERAIKAFAELGIELQDVGAPVGTLSGGQRQSVAVARAVVLVSHNMPEVLAVADRIEVLRMGRRVATFTAAQATVDELVGAMTGALELSNGTGAGGAK
jgi:simple sugar transport system ATP-binding protein